MLHVISDNGFFPPHSYGSGVGQSLNPNGDGGLYPLGGTLSFDIRVVSGQVTGGLVLTSNGTFAPGTGVFGPGPWVHFVQTHAADERDVRFEILTLGVGAEFYLENAVFIPNLPTTPDSTEPFCAITAAIIGGAKHIQLTIQDTGSGVKSIVASVATNLTVNIPAFSVGTTFPIVVTATKLNQSQSSVVDLRVTDVGGNTIDCDAVYHTVIRDVGKPNPVSFLVPFEQHFVQITNGSPGIRSITVWINDLRLGNLSGLKDVEVQSLDLGSAFRPGLNVITFGEHGGKISSAADILIYGQR
jgi:hypothetical protein